uniref:PH domain-containing protein n=1 Tax=Hucho hucho TaxID=62062 RepID=A0A4W5PSY1_9TELE
MFQAKTVEEKRLWAHHIKRLILENHHTIVPQKAKEAILEKDSLNPGSGRYRYSPERLKKAVSCQAEDFPAEGRHGRRRSGKLVSLPLHIVKQCLCFMKTTLKPSHQSLLVTYPQSYPQSYDFENLFFKETPWLDICLVLS